MLVWAAPSEGMSVPRGFDYVFTAHLPALSIPDGMDPAIMSQTSRPTFQYAINAQSIQSDRQRSDVTNVKARRNHKCQRQVENLPTAHVDAANDACNTSSCH